MKLFTLLLLLTVALLMNCSSSPLAGGTGTGSNIGEGKILGAVYLPDGQPGAGATIIMREQAYIPLSTSIHLQREITADSNGAFIIDSIDSGYFLLEMKNVDSLFALQKVFVPHEDSVITIGDVILDKQVEYRGTILKNHAPAAGADVLVTGMDRQCKVNNDGTFSLFLPSAQHLFRIIPADYDTAFEINFNDSNSGDTINLFTSEAITIIEDFDSLNDHSSLHSVNGGGYWFSYTDEIEGGGSRVDPALEDGIEEALEFEEELAYRGGSLHLKMLIDNSRSSPYAVVGCNIGGVYDSINDTGNVWFDLSKMTSLTFMAKGDGAIKVQLKCQFFDQLNKSYRCIIETPVELTSAWKKYSILPSDFSDGVVPGISASISYATALLSVNSICFAAEKSVDLFLDDIIIEGMVPQDFASTQ